MKPICQKLWIFIVILCTYVSASAYDFQVDGIYYKVTNQSNNEVSVTNKSNTGDSYSGVVTIPPSVNYNGSNYKVTSIADFAFYKCENLTNISLPESILSIGAQSFRFCSKLTRIDLPESVVSLGSFAFGGCSSVKEIQLSPSLKEIPYCCFIGCPLTKLDLPNGIERIDSWAFSDLTEQTTLILPPSINDIGRNALPFNVNLIILNGNISWENSLLTNTLYILDDTYPTFDSEVGNIYVLNKETFINENQIGNINSIHQLNEGIESVSFNYTGLPQGPNRNAMNWEIGDILSSAGINFEFKGIKNIDCGHWTDTEEVVFSYKEWSNTVSMYYDYTINPIPLKVSVNNVSREYGEDNPEFSVSFDGLVERDRETNILESVVYKTEAIKSSDIGDYPISVTATAKNYTLNFINGLLSVQKAPLILTVNNATRKYGSVNPEFKFTYQGLKLSDEVSSIFTQLPKATTEATEKSDVGSYAITATGGASKNYEIVEYKSGILTVTKAPLTLSANDVERLYYTDNPEFSFILDGLLNDDTESCISKAPIYNCSATITSNCGDYPIIPSEAEAKNYDITYQNGKLTINPSALILVASDIAKVYGDPNPLLRYEAIGLKGDDNLITSLIDEPILSTTVTESSNVGEYPISITGGSARNYKLNYRNGVLCITKAPLIVIADDVERVYGDNNPSFSRSYFGLKLNDVEYTAFSTLPKITCSANKTSDTGKYTLTVAGGISRNYEVTQYQNGTLTITKAPLILTANNKSRLYYESNPLFDYTLTGLKNGDTKSCIITAPSYTCTGEITSNAGKYQIIPSNAEAKNYSLEYQNGILTVNQRPLSASVGNYTRKYNAENPVFMVNYTGFVNSEDSSVLSRQATISCEANKTSDVGTYTLIPTGGEAINYVITKYTNGTLTIEKADQTLTWDQDLSNIGLHSQIALTANSDAGLPVSYEMGPNNVATLYDSAGVWYLDCYGSGAVNIRAIQNGTSNYNAASMIVKTLVVSGSGGEPSNPQIYLHVETAGTLPTLIAENRKNQIKNLRLTGYLNGTDIKYLREMAGSDSYGNTTTGILEALDISRCTIVSGGRSYYRSYQTSNYKVGDYMFYNCKVLVNLQLPDNTSLLGSYALADCDRLSNLSLPNSVTSFGSYAFRNDICLLRIPMPNSLTNIGDMAFYGCNGLSELTIPKNVSYLGDGILNACENITQINVEDGSRYFASQYGILYSSTFDKLLIFPANYESNSYVVKEGTTTIASYAFINSKKLNEVILPSTLANIGKDAFIGCINLSSLQVKTLTPPVCDNDCFEAVSKTRCELIVPKGCYNYYWVAPVWSDFNKIKESDFSGINDISFNEIKITIENHHIVINGVPENIPVHIFQVNGAMVYQAQSDGNNLYYHPSQSGTYIVVIANRTYKLMVR